MLLAWDDMAMVMLFVAVHVTTRKQVQSDIRAIQSHRWCELRFNLSGGHREYLTDRVNHASTPQMLKSLTTRPRGLSHLRDRETDHKWGIITICISQPQQPQLVQGWITNVRSNQKRLICDTLTDSFARRCVANRISPSLKAIANKMGILD